LSLSLITIYLFQFQCYLFEGSAGSSWYPRSSWSSRYWSERWQRWTRSTWLTWTSFHWTGSNIYRNIIFHF